MSVPLMSACVQTSQIVHVQYVQFFVYQSHLNKAARRTEQRGDHPPIGCPSEPGSPPSAGPEKPLLSLLDRSSEGNSLHARPVWKAEQVWNRTQRVAGSACFPRQSLRICREPLPSLPGLPPSHRTDGEREAHRGPRSRLQRERESGTRKGLKELRKEP